MIGYALRQVTGSWKPAFLWPVGVQALAFWMWLRYASVTPAKVTYDERERQRLS
jgi:hypothetical protein